MDWGEIQEQQRRERERRRQVAIDVRVITAKHRDEALARGDAPMAKYCEDLMLRVERALAELDGDGAGIRREGRDESPRAIHPDSPPTTTSADEPSS